MIESAHPNPSVPKLFWKYARIRIYRKSNGGMILESKGVEEMYARLRDLIAKSKGTAGEAGLLDLEDALMGMNLKSDSFYRNELNLTDDEPLNGILLNAAGFNVDMEGGELFPS